MVPWRPMRSPPQVNAFLLCDLAFQQAYTGKWCVIGTFGIIWARSFPVVHTPLVVFVGLSDFKGDATVEVHLRDDAGQGVSAVRAQIPPIPMPVAEFAMPFPPVTLKKAGTYTLELLSEGQLLAVRSFRVEMAQAPKLPPPPGAEPDQPEGI